MAVYRGERGGRGMVAGGQERGCLTVYGRWACLLSFCL